MASFPEVRLLRKTLLHEPGRKPPPFPFRPFWAPLFCLMRFLGGSNNSLLAPSLCVSLEVLRSSSSCSKSPGSLSPPFSFGIFFRFFPWESVGFPVLTSPSGGGVRYCPQRWSFYREHGLLPRRLVRKVRCSGTTFPSWELGFPPETPFRRFFFFSLFGRKQRFSLWIISGWYLKNVSCFRPDANSFFVSLVVFITLRTG